MKKAIIQGLITIALFLSAWFILAKVDWLSIFKVERLTNSTEERLGELFWQTFRKAGKENKDLFVNNALDTMVTKICKANAIDRKFIKVHVLEKDDVNAFALPNGHLVVYSGLILNSDSPEALSGVIAHEIAHIQLHHVMKKLVKEIGLSALISMTTGNGGAEVIKAATKMLSSSAFDRELERDADLKAVDYLVKAKVNPEPFANFLYQLSEKEDTASNYLTWVSTHPESKARAAYLVEYSAAKKTLYELVLTAETWTKLKVTLHN